MSKRNVSNQRVVCGNKIIDLVSFGGNTKPVMAHTFDRYYVILIIGYQINYVGYANVFF